MQERNAAAADDDEKEGEEEEGVERARRKARGGQRRGSLSDCEGFRALENALKECGNEGAEEVR